MTTHNPWCGCDPNHLPTHERGKMRGCKFANDPKELLSQDTQQFLKNPTNVADAIALLRKWMAQYG